MGYQKSDLIMPEGDQGANLLSCFWDNAGNPEELRQEIGWKIVKTSICNSSN